MVPSEGVRAGVLVADVTEGGGVGLFRRPVVRERKAVKSAWVEERRSGVRGTWSAGGDMRLGVAREVRLLYGVDMSRLPLEDREEGAMRVAQAHRVYHPGCCRGGAGGAHLLSRGVRGEGWKQAAGEAARQRLTAGESTGGRFAGREEGKAASRHMMDGI